MQALHSKAYKSTQFTEKFTNGKLLIYGRPM